MDPQTEGLGVKSLNTIRIPIVLIFLHLFLGGCNKNVDPEIEKVCKIDIGTIDFTFGIDYSDLDKYLIPGEQSDLKDSYLEEIRDAVGTPEDNMDDVLEVCHWINQQFTFENAGGAMMGVNTVDELYEIKTFYGCHSLALIISSVLREFGFPAVMIETADVQWAYNYHAGYFVFAKGVDTWDYSAKDESFTHDNMVYFSDNVYCFEDMFYTVSYTWKP